MQMAGPRLSAEACVLQFHKIADECRLADGVIHSQACERPDVCGRLDSRISDYGEGCNLDICCDGAVLDNRACSDCAVFADNGVAQQLSERSDYVSMPMATMVSAVTVSGRSMVTPDRSSSLTLR